MTAAPAIALGSLPGLATGIGGYRFIYARGTSCVTDDRAAGANCQVIEEQYDGWLASSHRGAAVCNGPSHAAESRGYRWTGGSARAVAVTDRGDGPPLCYNCRTLGCTRARSA